MKLSSATVAVSAVLVVLAVGVGSAFVLDLDEDGVPTHDEFGATDPLSADTDGDGLDDRREREFGSDPTITDTDGDGLTDSEEYWGTEGHGKDIGSDNGGPEGGGAGGGGGRYAPNEVEVEWERSDPTDSDTDGDGIDDGTEVGQELNPTTKDTDGDGLTDPRELDGPTDPTKPDTDGDNLLDSWEIRGETDKGANIADADPLHKDAFVHVLYLRGADEEVSSSVFSQVELWFDRMPVQNPDGETGIRVHFTGDQQTDRSIDEWERDDGSTTDGVSGYMTMREFYNRETIGEKTGSHFLVAIPGDGVPVRGGGNAGGTKTSIIRQWSGHGKQHYARTIVHEMLHNMVRHVSGQDCNGQLHTCEGFLSYTEDIYLSDAAKEKLDARGFADPEYPEQMNATDCEETMTYEDQCGLE